MRFVTLGLLMACGLPAQWVLQESHTTADLRGIYAVSNRVVWASGTHGTVLHSFDGGATWLTCPVPAGAEQLDFRAVQAFDGRTALVMSAGKGDLSRLYRTNDGCGTWRLVFSNPDKDGFWDGMQFSGRGWGVLVGDPVDGLFALFETSDGGISWRRMEKKVAAQEHQALFAASNSSLLLDGRRHTFYLATGGGTNELISANGRSAFEMATGDSAGGFSVAARDANMVVVGGDYRKPDGRESTAGRWVRGKYSASESMPHGYRSSVAFDPREERFVAVGTNGTDISIDDGLTWKPMEGGDGNWNALSVPFVVGPKGRIGRLR